MDSRDWQFSGALPITTGELQSVLVDYTLGIRLPSIADRRKHNILGGIEYVREGFDDRVVWLAIPSPPFQAVIPHRRKAGPLCK